MKIEKNVKADEHSNNQNQCVKPGMKVKSRVKAGSVPDSPDRWSKNHIQTVARGMKVKSRVKAGIVPDSPDRWSKITTR
jgi:hypothetical protein